MTRFGIVACMLICASSAIAQTAAKSDPLALSLARESIKALTSGEPLTDVVINASISSPNGEETDTGNATFRAKGVFQSRVDLSLGSGTRTETRAAAGRGAWKGNDGKATAFAAHNCQTDASWFFPALSALSQVSNPRFVFTYIGDDEHGAVNTHHIRVYQTRPGEDGSLVERLSTEDFYLDAQTGLPVAVTFKMHPDSDLLTNLDAEIRFGNYQKVSDVLVPYSFQRVVNGAVVLDAAVTNVVVNSGSSDSEFDVE